MLWKKNPLLLAAAALAAALVVPAAAEKSKPAPKAALSCPVMKAPIPDKADAGFATVNNEPVYVCCPGCIGAIKKEPAKYLKKVKDPVTGKPFTVTAKTPKVEHGDGLFLFASTKSRDTFQANPARYTRR
ncbi:MAG: hypothetical protein ACK47B_03260 [Armatimonadota bacterium]